jgi:hypothetical protein
MNILAFKDIENYLSNRQVWNNNESVGSDLKTIIPSRTVVAFKGVYAKCISPDRYALDYSVNGESHRYVYMGTQYGFFAWIKNQFVPVEELVEAFVLS